MNTKEDFPNNSNEKEGFNLQQKINELEEERGQEFSGAFKKFLSGTEPKFAEFLLALPKDQLGFIDDFLNKYQQVMEADGKLMDKVDDYTFSGETFQDKLVDFIEDFKKECQEKNNGKYHKDRYLMYHILAGSTPSNLNDLISDVDIENPDSDLPNNSVVRFLNQAREDLQKKSIED